MKVQYVIHAELTAEQCISGSVAYSERKLNCVNYDNPYERKVSFSKVKLAPDQLKTKGRVDYAIVIMINIMPCMKYCGRAYWSPSLLVLWKL